MKHGAARRREPAAGTPPARERIAGRYGDLRRGPLLVAIGGLHGNEPAGVHAIRRVLSELERRAPAFRGGFVGVQGNLAALAAGVRFVERDLNRGWNRGRLAALRGPAGRYAGRAGTEDAEQRELAVALERLLAGASGPVHVIDIHTTSADSVPFLTLGDTLRNRAFARRIPLPLVLGIEEQIDHTLLSWLNRLGPATLGVEAGRHDDPAAVEHASSVLWCALVAAGCLEPDAVPRYRRLRRDLRRARGSLPSVFEVRHRQPVPPGDAFRMRSGYRNFQPIRRGEPLADLACGPVAAPETGRVFLPLYQELGDDGFFVVREVHPFWLRLSGLLRRLRLGGLLSWLPGVHRARRRPDTLIVDRRVARWRVVEVFHLLGYRRARTEAGWLVFTRRSHGAGFAAPGARR